MIYNVIYFWFF